MKFSNLEMASRVSRVSVSAEVAGKVSEYVYYHRSIDFPGVSGISVDPKLVKR